MRSPVGLGLHRQQIDIDFLEQLKLIESNSIISSSSAVINWKVIRFFYGEEKFNLQNWSVTFRARAAVKEALHQDKQSHNSDPFYWYLQLENKCFWLFGYEFVMDHDVKSVQQESHWYKHKWVMDDCFVQNK